MKIASITRSDRGILVENDEGESFLVSTRDDLAGTLREGGEIGDELRVELKERSQDYRCYLCAVDALARRDRSEKEMVAYLRRKGFSQERAGRAVDLLREKGFIDDLRYARARAQNISGSKKAGNKYIERKLREKGIDRRTIQMAVEDIEEPSFEEIFSIALKKWQGLKDKKNSREKLAAFLSGRGFKGESIRLVLRQLALDDDLPGEE